MSEYLYVFYMVPYALRISVFHDGMVVSHVTSRWFSSRLERFSDTNTLPSQSLAMTQRPPHRKSDQIHCGRSSSRFLSARLAQTAMSQPAATLKSLYRGGDRPALGVTVATHSHGSSRDLPASLSSRAVAMDNSVNPVLAPPHRPAVTK